MNWYVHADGLGSVTALTNASGTVVQTYSYDSFGNMTANGSVSQPYTYTGREYDSETGMYFYRARYYDPKVGRFVTKDPIGFEGGDINLYNYVSANPVNYVDPNGTACQVDVYRTQALMSSGINAGHEWIVYGSQSVGFWPNRNWQVIRPDPAEAAGVPKVYHWGTSQLEAGEIKWGSGAGKNCKCATCEDIHSCLSAVPNPGWRSLPIFNNCRRFVRSWALPGCCLNTN